MANPITAWAAREAGGRLAPMEYDPGPLGPNEVEIAVDHCGVCHSDLSMIEDEWHMTRYPFVPGHEAVGRIADLGEYVKGLDLGQRVGLGWTASSCMHCRWCLSGEQHLCRVAQGTIIGRHGAFGDRVRAHWLWAVPLPEHLDYAAAGPLLCGGITVFAPLLAFGVKPTDRVGVVGIGGLGHMALMFASAWGCEVTAFTSSASKHEEARALGAHHVVSSRDPAAMKAIGGTLDFVIDTVNVPLDWDALMATLAPKGRLHVVGAVLEPIPVTAMTLIGGQQSISGSPTGSRSAIDAMLAFAARHRIAPKVEHYPIGKVDEAFEHLSAGKARYRVVLDMTRR
jgi:uncharacterized zinc-type alcohol dehydrogenase-like protein